MSHISAFYGFDIVPTCSHADSSFGDGKDFKTQAAISGGSRIRNKRGGGGTLQAQWNKFTFTMTFVILEHVNVWALLV